MVAQNDADALFRPYAPPANVVAVLQRIRRMNMPPRITREFMSGAGISPNIISRVVACLRFLGLTNHSEEPTEHLAALASATDDEYRQLLEQVIRTAYQEDFANINPATDLQPNIISAFQKYTPRSQHQRQVMLFLGLCREAGMDVADSPRERKMQASRPRRAEQGGKTPGVATIERKHQPDRSGAEGLMFGVTEEDIAALSDEEFDTVWDALGTVARARAKARISQTASDNTDADGGDES